MKRRWLIGLAMFLAFTACKKKTENMTTTLAIPPVENKTGVVFYPNSTEWGTASAAGDENRNASTARQTDDPPEKVIEFYKKEIKDGKVNAENFSGIVHTTVTGKTKDGAEVEVLVMKMPEQKTQIFVSRR